MPSKFGEAKVTKSREQNKRILSFFCRDGVSSPSLMAELQKKLVKAKQFWKINANRLYEIDGICHQLR